ncbi:hypothetical protein C8J31_105131 [Rhizobium sp. PP-CC-2G-626]|nr:hypothetical protein C8J31_105131 [Rhizobium sp. PP-CC-2G-626]
MVKNTLLVNGEALPTVPASDVEDPICVKTTIRGIRQMADILVLLMEDCDRNVRALNEHWLPALSIDYMIGLDRAMFQTHEISDRISRLCEATEVAA